MSKIKGFPPCAACHRDGPEDLKMLQEPPCCWTHRHWIWISSPQSVGSTPPSAFHSPTATNTGPPPLVSVPSWEAALRSWRSTQQGSEQCRCPPHHLPIPSWHGPTADGPLHLQFLSLLLRQSGIATVTHGQRRTYH